MNFAAMAAGLLTCNILSKTVHCTVKWAEILTGKMGLSFGLFSYTDIGTLTTVK